jgi:hypothetical protein
MNHTTPRPRAALLLFATLAVTVGCPRDPAPTEDAAGGEADPAAAIPDEPLPALRTGPIEPGVHAELTGSVTERGRLGDAQVLVLDLPGSPEIAQAMALRAGLDGDPDALVVAVRRNDRLQVAIRRTPRPDDEPVAGSVWLASHDWPRTRWARAPFRADPAGAKDGGETTAATLRAALATALDDADRTGASHPFRAFAAARLRTARGVAALEPSTPRPPTELVELMATTTGAMSLQESLQHERGLLIRAPAQRADVPIADLAGPPLAAHPFAQMRAALPAPDAATPEPLAAAVPADGWYVRFADIRALLRVLDEADAWITPAAHLLDGRPEVRDLSARYQRQLGLRRSGLARALGHTVVARLAATGSDPYVREGSDLTFVFELVPGAKPAFDAELSRHLDTWRGEVPGVQASGFVHGGVSVAVQSDPAGRVRQHRATVGGLELVSNSAGGIRRVLDTLAGSRPSLASTEDFRYMAARDPGEHDAIAFFGDSFIAAVIGPAQKIAQARRQQALGELLAPGFASLLHGWLHGRPPATLEELVAGGLASREDLAHADGSPIAFTPADGARSRFGTPAALTPLIDLPTVTAVTAAERDAYARFSEGYQQYWRQFIDPVAVHLDLEDGADGAHAVLDVRVLPIIEGTGYDDIRDVVGTARVTAPPIDGGARMLWAVGDSELRRDLDRTASALGGHADIGIGWLGDWVEVGTLDRTVIARVAALVDEPSTYQVPRAERTPTDDFELWNAVGRLPVWAAADVSNPAALVATLTALKTSVNQVAPGMVEWGEHSRRGEVPIVRVGVSPSAPDESVRAYAEALAIYYAQTGDTIVLGLDPAVVGVLVERQLGKRGPTGDPKAPAQFVVELATERGRGLWTALTWALQGQANAGHERALLAAEAILRGRPETRGDPAAFARVAAIHLGAVPVTPSGTATFALGPDGANDPMHGSIVRPIHPPLPLEGAPVTALTTRLVGFRGEIAFDDEPGAVDPPAKSLHARARLKLAADAVE